MTIEELRDGYFALLDDLYHPDAFFARMDAMCFETGWLPAPGRTRYLRRHPLRRLRLRVRAGIEALYIFVQLMRRVPNPMLRRRYRRQLLKVLTRRPNPRLVRIYAMFCALHFHYDKLIAQFKATPPDVSAGETTVLTRSSGATRRRKNWIRTTAQLPTDPVRARRSAAPGARRR